MMFENLSTANGLRLIATLAARMATQAEKSELAAEGGTIVTPAVVKYDPAVLAAAADQQFQRRRIRDKILKIDILGEPAWDMLLDLFARRVRGEETLTKQVCFASGVPSTTALRYLAELERQGLVVRHKGLGDERQNIVTLTNEGYNRMAQCLSHCLSEETPLGVSNEMVSQLIAKASAETLGASADVMKSERAFD